MQRILLLLVLFLAFSCSPEDPFDEIITDTMDDSSSSNTPEGPILDERNKDTILNYFEALIASEQVLVGQQCGNDPVSTRRYYNTHVEQLADQTGKYVGLIGADFGWSSGNKYPVTTLIDHWSEGGLVAASWHADNPFVPEIDVYWDSVKNSEQINLKALLKDAEQTTAWKNYRNELDNVATALQKLRDAGVTVIWRPFHEMNGDFFWWGTNANGNKQTNEADFKALWIDLYDTLTLDYGLDNLIWTYSVVPSETWYAAVTAYYPGSEYVDLVGMDYYGDELGFPHYEELKSLGKPLVISESGPREAGSGNWNMMQWADKLKGKAAYFLQWHSYAGIGVAIKDNQNSMEMMTSDVVITRDELLPISF